MSAAKRNQAPPVLVAFVGIGTTSGRDQAQYDPPEGWFIDEVLPAAASNGLGVLIVMRPMGFNDGAPPPSSQTTTPREDEA